MSQNYPSNWDTLRKKVYRKDGYQCQNCQAYGGPKGNAELRAHHVVPVSKGGTNEMSNLITVCEKCHKSIHGDVMAPTSNQRNSQKSATSSQKRTHNPFTCCPLCNSSSISHHPSEDKTLQCEDCWSTLSKDKIGRFEVRVGPRGHNRTVGAFTSEMDGLTLAPRYWKLLSDKESFEGIDIEKLKSQSDRWARGSITINRIGILIGAVGVILSVLESSILYWILGVVSALMVMLIGRVFTRRRLANQGLPIK